eukprot:scaffold54220_cov61-Phaeocystis_antarctica.AAC.3
MSARVALAGRLLPSADLRSASSTRMRASLVPCATCCARHMSRRLVRHPIPSMLVRCTSGLRPRRETSVISIVGESMPPVMVPHS